MGFFSGGGGGAYCYFGLAPEPVDAERNILPAENNIMGEGLA